MKKPSPCLIVAVIILTTVTALAGTPSFSDIDGHWAKDYILETTSRGIFSGNPDGTFAPERVITRAELAVVLTRTLDLPFPTDPTFSFRDAWKIPAWAQGPVAAVVKADLMQGRGDGTFGPLAPVTREEAAVVFVRALGMAQEAEEFTGQPGFTDDQQISAWARGPASVARRIGLFTGDPEGRFLPQQSLKRGEAARVVSRFLELSENTPVLGWTGETSSGQVAITTVHLNLRSGPGTSFSRIGLLPPGASVPVEEVVNVNGETWYRVTYQGKQGYIAAWYTRLAPAGGKGGEDNDPRLLATTTTHLNVRTGPSTSYPRLGLLPPQTTVPVEKEVVNSQGEKWLRISFEGKTAYIAAEYTTLTQLPVAPTEGETAPGGEIPAPGDQSSAGKEDKPPASSPPDEPDDGEPSAPETEPKPPEVSDPSEDTEPKFRVINSDNSQGLRLVIPGQQVTVATLNTNLNVRAAPGTWSERLGGLPAGTEVLVERVVNAGDEEWLEIPYQGGKAYIAAWYTTISQVSRDVPAPGVNEITLTRINDSLYTLTVRGTEPLSGKLRTDAGRITLQITNGELPAVRMPLSSGPFTQLGSIGDTIYLEHQLQQVEPTLRAAGDGSLQVLLGLNPDDPELGRPVGSQGILAGKVIALDAGHGGSDPGAIGTTYGTREKDVVLDITLRTASILEAQEARVILTRSQDRDLSLVERVNISNSYQPHIFISIHADFNYNPSIGGFTVYYSSANPHAAESLRLGSSILDALEQNLGLRRVGVRDSNFYVLRNNNVPAVLVETAFLSNPQEEAFLREEWFRKQAAEGIAAGIGRYFQLAF